MSRPLVWYFSRLKQMSGIEVASRIAKSVRMRFQKAGWWVADCPPPPLISPAAVWLHTSKNYCVDSRIRSANRIISGVTSIFALENIETTGPRKWNRDPLTGVVAPLTFGPSIDIHSQAKAGNIKYLWEPNRHHDLVVLAQAFRLTGNPEYLKAIKGHLYSWFEQCPYLLGPNWNSGLELAIRLINWSLTWQMIGGERSLLFDGVDGKQCLGRWLDSIYQHVHFINGYYSQFSSANNHLIGEAAGVFVATCTWPFWEIFGKWGEQSKRRLVEAALAQNHNDGVNREQAISYQQFVLDFLIIAALAGRVRGQEFPKDYWRIIERMLEYIQAIMDVDGNMPMIGDADDGYVVKLSQESNFCPYRSLLATGAILFGRPDFAAKSGGLDDKTRFLVGQDRWVGLSSEDAGLSANQQRQFSEGGYYMLGQDFGTEEEIRLLVDAGPLGYLSIAAHGHADALAIYLSVAGREFLVDPGTYTYHGKPVWREYFRGTRAHNTLIVDNQDQSVQSGSFMWTQHAQARCTEFKCGVDHDVFVGEHDGYQRLDDPVIHQRKITRTGASFDIVDTIKCREKHTVERCWHFSEQCKVSVSGSTVTAENDGVKISLTPGNAETEIVCLKGSENPIGGWISRHFDVKTASTSVYFVDRVVGKTERAANIQCLPQQV